VRKRIFYIIPVFFSLLIASPLVFIAGVQTFQLYTWHRMERTLEQDKLQTISFPASKIQWVEKGREILVENKMFDIKSYSIENGIFTAQGVYDEHETKAVNLLNGHISEGQQNFFVIRLLLLVQCFIALVYFTISFHLKPSIKKTKSYFFKKYSNPFLLLFTPPPKPFFISFY